MYRDIFKKLLPLFLVIAAGYQSRAQDSAKVTEPPPAATQDSALLQRVSALEEEVSGMHHGDENNFMVAGLATFGFVRNSTTATVGGVSTTTKTRSLGDVDHYEFSPMLLWRHGTKFLAEFEPSFDGSSLGVNWACISYFARPGLIVRGGYFVLPFGTYNKRLAAGWIDKLPGDPAVSGILPGSDFGVEVEGGLPLGNGKWNYDVSLTNGFSVDNTGALANAGIVDNNNNKTLTGRLGILPFANSSLELGASAMVGKVGNPGTIYANTKGTAYGFDLNYVKAFDPVLLNLKAQYSVLNVDNANYYNPDSTTYTFTNKTDAGFAQLSFRPVQAKSNFAKNLELALRYDYINTPKLSQWGAKTSEFDIGIDYWFSWREVLKFGYLYNKTTPTVVTGSTDNTKSNSFIIQFSIQL